MTQPPRTDPRLARDVAKHLDRRRMRRRVVVWTALLAAVIAASMYLTCGHGFGLGGAGEGPGEGPGSARPLTGPRRCTVRVAATGITVDGKAMSRSQAVAACKAAGGADVLVTGDAREGEWKALKAALESAVTDIVVHEPPHGR